METTQLRPSRTPILAGTPTSATGQSPTIPDFDPNARKRTGATRSGQQRREGATTPPDITAGILEAGRAAQRQARECREALQQTPKRQDEPTSKALLRSCKDCSGENDAQAAPSAGKTPIFGPLGGKGEKPAPSEEKTSKSPNAKKEAEKARERLETWQMMDAARHLLTPTGHRTATCHRLIVPSTAAQVRDGSPKLRGVDIHHTTHQDGTTRARFGNLITCGSVWACPICAARIAAERAAEVDRALKAHREEGGRLMFLTLTHHHERESKLADQLKAQGEALRAMQNDWKFKDLCDKGGVLGMVRGLEMTHSDSNGWHAHLHFLVFLAGNEQQAQRHADVLAEIDAERAASIAKQGKTPRVKHTRKPVQIPKATALPKLGRDLITQWQKAAKKAGLYTVRDAQSATIPSDDDATLETLAHYLTKCEEKTDEDGKKQWVSTGEDNPEAFGGEAAHRDAVRMVEAAGQRMGGTLGAEMTMLNGKKRSRTPHGMLRMYTFGRVPKADTPERKAADRKARRMGALFVEFVTATKGKNALSWGQGLKRMYAVTEQTDEQAAQKDDENTALDVVLMTLTPDDWQTVLQGPRGTRGELLEVARTGDPAAVFAYVQGLRDKQARKKTKSNQKPSVTRGPNAP